LTIDHFIECDGIEKVLPIFNQNKLSVFGNREFGSILGYTKNG